MDKVYEYTPWWTYLGLVGFIIWGIYLLKSWRKIRNPNASFGERAFTEWGYLIHGIGAIIGGVVGLIVCIHNDCIGHL
jgi:hypothetical protein